MLPLFVPFAQAFAAVITAGLTGSLYYAAASPKGVFDSPSSLFWVVCLAWHIFVKLVHALFFFFFLSLFQTPLMWLHQSCSLARAVEISKSFLQVCPISFHFLPLTLEIICTIFKIWRMIFQFVDKFDYLIAKSLLRNIFCLKPCCTNFGIWRIWLTIEIVGDSVWLVTTAYSSFLSCWYIMNYLSALYLASEVQEQRVGIW